MSEKTRPTRRPSAPRNEWKSSVRVLMGHAAQLYVTGQRDMPAWLYRLAEKLARDHVDELLAAQVHEVAEQMRKKYAPTSEAGHGVRETGVWTTGVCDRGVFAESSDFHHDARLYVDGDFQGTEKLAYATEIATRLNAWQAVNLALARPKDGALLPSEPSLQVQP